MRTLYESILNRGTLKKNIDDKITADKILKELKWDDEQPPVIKINGKELIFKFIGITSYKSIYPWGFDYLAKNGYKKLIFNTSVRDNVEPWLFKTGSNISISTSDETLDLSNFDIAIHGYFMNIHGNSYGKDIIKNGNFLGWIRTGNTDYENCTISKATISNTTSFKNCKLKELEISYNGSESENNLLLALNDIPYLKPTKFVSGIPKKFKPLILKMRKITKDQMIPSFDISKYIDLQGTKINGNISIYNNGAVQYDTGYKEPVIGLMYSPKKLDLYYNDALNNHMDTSGKYYIYVIWSPPMEQKLKSSKILK